MKVRGGWGGGGGADQLTAICVSADATLVSLVPFKQESIQPADKRLQLSSLFGTFPNINLNCCRVPLLSDGTLRTLASEYFYPESACCDKRRHHKVPGCNNARSNCLACSCLGYGEDVCWRVCAGGHQYGGRYGMLTTPTSANPSLPMLFQGRRMRLPARPRTRYHCTFPPPPAVH